MALFSIVAAVVFGFLQIKPMMFGPVGIAFQISSAGFVSTGIMIMAHDFYRSILKSGDSVPATWRYAQVRQFWEIPRAWKVIIWIGIPILPLLVDFIVKL